MTFEQLNLSAPLLRAVKEAGYETPSPIQAAAIPPVLEGRDLMGCAQTGTGKTAAFALPMLQRLAAAPARKNGAIRALVLTPTRELALQIGESFDAYGKYLPLRSLVIFGGVGQGPQVAALQKGVEILIACPGRLNDLIGQGFVDLAGVEVFVLDEADRMLDMGFVHDVKKVIAKLPARRQNLMFSATMPAEIEQLAAGILRKPAFVKVDPVSSTVERIDQSLYFVEKGNKRFLLPWLIQNLQPPVQNALVFSRTKHGADKIARELNKQGITAAAIHGNKSQNARVAALEGFKAGRTQVLVATDIAARGIDISELSHVFNYDLPEVPETYVHRIGRTARAGANGTAVSFCAPEEREYLAGIEKLNRRKIPVISGHPWDGVPAPARAEAPARGAAAPAAAPAPQKTNVPEPPRAPKRAAPSVPQEETNMENNNNNKPTPDRSPRPARGEGRRSRRGARQNGAAQAAQQQPQQAAQQPKFDPHFVSAPEAVPLRPAKKPAAPAPKQPAPSAPAAQGGEIRSAHNERPAHQNNAPQQRRGRGGQQPAQNGRSANQNAPAERSARPADSAPRNERSERAVRQESRRPARQNSAPQQRRGRGASAPARDEDPGLVLISRRPPQQKFSNFEEYMTAHGGASAPIEDYAGEE